MTSFTVVINDEKEIRARQGQSLFDGLAQADIFVPSACGGRAICGYCKVKVTKGGGEVLPQELPLLNEKELENNIRLSCQVPVNNDISIEIPKAYLSGRQFKCTCTRIEKLTHDIRLFRFRLDRPKIIKFVPGQFIQLKTPVYFEGCEEVYRNYSIASDPADNSAVELIIRRVPNGICTTYCFDHLKTGDKAVFHGPSGDFHLSDNDSPIVFIAGGSGMAPVRSMLYHMRNTDCKRKTVYYFGANKVRELFMIDQMRQFEKDLHDFRFVPVVALPDPDEKWDGPTGLVTQAVQTDLENAPDHEAYLCGSPGMVEASIAVLANLGLRENNLYYDKFT